jgi:hypothetical protein
MISIEGKQVFTELTELADPAHTVPVVYPLQSADAPGGAVSLRLHM